MNFHALLYYKYIADISHAYEQKIKEIDISSINDSNKKFNEVYDKTLFLFSQATETYCKIINQFNNAQLPTETKADMRDALDSLKTRCTTLLEMLETLQSKDQLIKLNNRIDPLKDYIAIGNYLYRYDRTQSLREMIEEHGELHQKSMTDVRKYKNAVINGFLSSEYKMTDVAEATHKLARSKALVEHCLMPAALISEEQDCAKIGKAVYNKMLQRENDRQVKTALTQQGLICTLYSRTLTIKEQQKVMDGQSVESILSKKGRPESLEQYEHVFSLITTDHTGLVYTQRNNKMGVLQMGKWLRTDDAKIGHLLTFKSQNEWDGTKEIKNRDFVNAIKSTIDMWKNFRDGVNEMKEKIATNPLRKKLDDQLNKICGQETAEKIADLIMRPKETMITIRSENPWAVIQSSTDLEFLNGIRHDNYLRILKRCLNKNAETNITNPDLNVSKWEYTTKRASQAINTASETLQYVSDAVKSQSVGLGSTLDMTSLLIEHTIPFTDFSAANIQESVKRMVNYADKLVQMAELNEQFLDTDDPSFKEKIKEIGQTFTDKELIKFVNDVNIVKESEEKAIEESNVQNLNR